MNSSHTELRRIAVSQRVEGAGPEPVVRFRYSSNAKNDPWAGTGELAKLMVRGWGVEVRPWGSSFADGESSVGWLVSRVLTPSEIGELKVFVERVSQMSLAERFRMRGPEEGEAPWAHLGISSDSETLRRWALAHYRSCGITEPGSLSEIVHGFNFRYCVLPVGMIDGHSPYTNEARVEAYASMMRDGILFPPLILAGPNNSLREGFHRKRAYGMIGQDAPCICFDLD